MKIILTARESDLADAWDYCLRQFSDRGVVPNVFANVSVYRGSILDLSVEAIVSPANSFGFMDGGLDRLYSDRFGWQVQASLQRRIQTKHHGELLVGAAEIIETDHPQIPYLIAAPTMRVPMVLGALSVNPYLAARAVLLLIKYGVFEGGTLDGEAIAQVIETVAFPGLGTGVGQISPAICARQVCAAIEAVMLEQNQLPRSWADAQKQHQQLCGDRVRDLQYE